MCFLVQADGHVLASRNADTPLIGASTQKLLVAAAALATLTPDFTYETRVVAPSAPSDGSVDKIWLVGSGDPDLATPSYAAFIQAKDKTRGDVTTSLDALADAIVAKGVQKIPGGVVVDDSRYDTERYRPTWKESYHTSGDIGPLGALTVNDGFSAWDPRKIVVDDPALNAGTQLQQLLKARGVQVGAVTRGNAPNDAAAVASVKSPPLKDIVTSMLRSSDNLTAELLVKELGVHASKQGTTAAGAAAVLAKLKELGVPVDQVVLDDGSGLSRENRDTCATLAAVLALGVPPRARAAADRAPGVGAVGHARRPVRRHAARREGHGEDRVARRRQRVRGDRLAQPPGRVRVPRQRQLHGGRRGAAARQARHHRRHVPRRAGRRRARAGAARAGSRARRSAPAGATTSSSAH